MTEMHASLQHLAHGDVAHSLASSVGLSLHASHAATRAKCQAPSRMCRHVCGQSIIPKRKNLGFPAWRYAMHPHLVTAHGLLIATARRALYHSRRDPGNCSGLPTRSLQNSVDASTVQMSVNHQDRRGDRKDARRGPAGRRCTRHDRAACPARRHDRRALDRLCHDYIVDVQHAIPAPLNYRGFPKSICTSVNHQVCHGIPGDKRLKNGDMLNIDVTVIKDGYHGDTSKMFFVGEPSVLARRLVTRHLEAMRTRHRHGPPRRAAGRYRPCHPALRRVPWLLGRARILRPRHRPRVP